MPRPASLGLVLPLFVVLAWPGAAWTEGWDWSRWDERRAAATVNATEPGTNGAEQHPERPRAAAPEEDAGRFEDTHLDMPGPNVGQRVGLGEGQSVEQSDEQSPEQAPEPDGLRYALPGPGDQPDAPQQTTPATPSTPAVRPTEGSTGKPAEKPKEEPEAPQAAAQEPEIAPAPKKASRRDAAPVPAPAPGGSAAARPEAPSAQKADPIGWGTWNEPGDSRPSTAKQQPLEPRSAQSPTSAPSTTPSSGPDDGGLAPGPDDGGLAPGPDDGGLAPGPDDGGLAPGPDDGGLASGPDDGGLAPGPDDGGLAALTPATRETPVAPAAASPAEPRRPYPPEARQRFLRAALADDEGRSSVLTRWPGDVDVAVKTPGQPLTPAEAALFDTVLARLHAAVHAASGHGVRRVTALSGNGVTVYALPSGPDGHGFTEKTHDAAGHITSARVVLYRDRLTREALARQLLIALGLKGGLKGALQAAPATEEAPAPEDLALLEMLYRPGLAPGMDPAAVAEALPRLVRP